MWEVLLKVALQEKFFEVRQVWSLTSFVKVTLQEKFFEVRQVWSLTSFVKVTLQEKFFNVKQVLSSTSCKSFITRNVLQSQTTLVIEFC